MKTRRILLSMAIAIGVAGAHDARADLPLIDDFAVGPYRVDLDAEGQNNTADPGRVQRDPSGQHILGGQRYTGYANAASPFGQGAVLDILPGGDALLAGSTGVRVVAGLQVYWGLDVNASNQNVVAPLHANFRPDYDRFRVNFDVANGSLNFNMQVRGSNGGLAGLGINTPGALSTASQTGRPFCVEFPFDGFVGFAPAPSPASSDEERDAFFTDVTYVNVLIAGTSGGMGGTDYAILSVEAANSHQGSCFVAKTKK